MITLGQLAEWVGGEVDAKHAQVTVTSVGLDTRTLRPDSLYVAYSGPRCDGHDFVAQARALGCAAALVSKWLDCDVPQVKVEDTLRALQTFAARHRQQYDLKVIALTGSCGKTTTRAFLQNICAQKFQVLATRGNLNNHIGVPLMLLELNHQHQLAIFELGANHVGEIGQLSSWVQPDVALITQAGRAHIEGFGSIEKVAQAKGEIYHSLSGSGCAVINKDDAFSDYWADSVPTVQKRYFSRQAPAEVWASRISVDAGVSFELHIGDSSVMVQLALLGAHNVENALAAAAAASAVGIDIETIRTGLEATRSVDGRLSSTRLPSGALVINDAYNANPHSVQAAIDTLSSVTGYQRRIIVLGDMLELGTQASEWHRELGLYAREKGVDALFSYGSMARQFSLAFGLNGRHFTSYDALCDAVRGCMNAQTVVLIKGSNSLGLQQVAQALNE